MYSHYYYPNELYHHGVKGQKWGVRRFQNRDGSLTSAGERHRDQIDGSSGRSSGGSAKSAARKKRLKRILGATLGAAAVAGAAYGVHKYGGARKLALDSKQFAKSRLQKARDKYADWKDDRRLDRELGYGMKERLKSAGSRVWDKTNRGYERATMTGHNAKRRLHDAKTKASINYNLAKANYYIKGGAKGLAKRAGSKVADTASRGYERAALYGHKAKNAAVDSAYRVGERAALYGHKVSSVPSKVRRFYTTSGGARGLAADAKAGVRSAASRFGSGAANAARTAGGALDRTIGVKARYAKLTAQDAYQKRKKKRYYKNYNRPIDVAYTVS